MSDSEDGSYSDEAEEVRPGAEEVSGDSEPEGENIANSDYDSEEEDETERGGHGQRPAKKKRPDKYGGFILEEAEEDGDGDDSDDWDADNDYDVVGNEENEVGPTAPEIEQQLRREQMMWYSQDENEIEEYYRRKYAEEGGARYFNEASETSEEITQQTLLPGVKDPNLWMIRCRIGEEKATVMQLMRKFITYDNTDEPLQIKSVVAPEGVKGYIYLEAYKQTHVALAVQGISNLRMGLYKQQMVPIKEMTDVMRVIKDQVKLKSGCWVRLKRSIFKDDIAQVDYVTSAQNSVHLKLIPRIDYTRMRGALRNTEKENDLKRKRRRRPPQKLLDIETLRSIGGEFTQDGDFIIFEGNQYSRKGFLYKSFNISAIQTEGVKPTLSELEKFEEQPEGVDVELAHSAKLDEDHNLSPGDNVEVTDGELINLQGKILKVEGNKITMLPKHEDLKDPLEFPAHELRKYFRMGDHAKVISGRYQGDTGLVVCVEENLIVLFSDLTMHELKVLPNDIQLCSDMATGVDSMGQFQYGDMVQLDPLTVGVIVRLERENLHVLSMHGKVVKVRPQAVHKRRDNRHAVALDTEQNSIQRRDIVKVIDGPHSGRQGEIKHLFRSFAFLYSRMMVENGGIFVCRARHLVLAGGSKNNSGGSGGMSSSLGFMSPRLSSPARPGGGPDSGGGGSAGGGGRGRGRGGFRVGRDKHLIGQTIKITQGPFKGYVGVVKDATESTARVELHSNCQTISVDKNRVAVVGAGPRAGSLSTYNKTPLYTGAGGATPMYGSAAGGRTPLYSGAGGATPLHDGSRTPLYGNQTPLHDGGATPSRSGAWDPAVANTPARPDFDDYSFADSTPSPSNYNPGTPGFSSYSPYQPSPSPNTHLSGASSQAGSIGASPAPYLASPSPYMPSPGSSALAGGGGPGSSPAFANSPAIDSYSPGSVGTPTVPGELANQDWVTTDIEVRIGNGHMDRSLVGVCGVVRNVSGAVCSLMLAEQSRVVTVLAENVEPVRPQHGDRVKVILGEDREACGHLLSIDHHEGVVSLDDGEVKMLQHRFLCKLHTE